MYKKLRFYLRFIRALTAKHWLPILLGLTLAVISAIVAPRLFILGNRIGNVRRIGIIGRYTLNDLPLSLMQKVSIGLTNLDPTGVASPGIASSWQATDSGKTYIFTIDRSLVWHDGSSVKSQDIRYNFRDASIEYPDSDHLLIKLTDPFSPLPSVVSRPVLKTSGLLTRFNRPQISGLGTYRIKSYRKNGSLLSILTLVPVPSNSALPGLIYHFYSSGDQARLALKLGILHEIVGLTEPNDLSSWSNLEINSHTQKDRYIGIFFNTQDPQLSGPSGKNLRLALTYAIDKSRWSDRALGPISPESWAFNSEVKKYDLDPAKAKELLKKVEKIPESVILSTVPAYSEIAEDIKKDWSAIGVDTKIIVSTELPSEYQIILIAQAIPSDPDQYNLWHSTQDTTNLSRLKNPRIDKLLEDGRKTSDYAVRFGIYSDFQKFLLEEAQPDPAWPIEESAV